ncbi:hypothetical protein C0995_015083 [Termitomyces sp. Mi166|nr:hypothetical protein C0995_015083 [Termitomyces sp. Mi166\
MGKPPNLTAQEVQFLLVNLVTSTQNQEFKLQSSFHPMLEANRQTPQDTLVHLSVKSTQGRAVREALEAWEGWMKDIRRRDHPTSKYLEQVDQFG